MLEKPTLKNNSICMCLQDEYGLTIRQVAFLPLGADMNTAVYRVGTNENTHYFLKLRKGVFDETAVVLSKFLSDQGIAQIIPPLPTQTGHLWGKLDQYKTILYPFIEGHNGYEVVLSDDHWHLFGSALRQIHTTKLPVEIVSHIRKETYSAQYRESMLMFLARLHTERFDEPVAIQLTAFLQTKSSEIIALVKRTEMLAQLLQKQPQELIVCHSDLHAGNIFMGDNGDFYIVDWDEPILAPKERDLMYIGGGLLASGLVPQAEEQRFYAAYGQKQVNSVALAYYRYERIIQDIVAFCEQLLLTTKGGEDREQSLYYLKSNFLPNQTLEIAYQTDETS